MPLDQYKLSEFAGDMPEYNNDYLYALNAITAYLGGAVTALSSIIGNDSAKEAKIIRLINGKEPGKIPYETVCTVMSICQEKQSQCNKNEGMMK